MIKFNIQLIFEELIYSNNQVWFFEFSNVIEDSDSISEIINKAYTTVDRLIKHQRFAKFYYIFFCQDVAFGNIKGFSFFNFFFLIFLCIVVIVCMLIAIAYYTLAERKVMAFMQRRRGPNVVGFWGFLQPLADGIKLALKEIIIPRKANSLLFLFAPILTFALALISWTVIPFNSIFTLNELRHGLIFLLAISSLGVYGIIIAGWASNSNYAFLGALRSTAQMISYEITISFIILIIVCFSGTFNLYDIIECQRSAHCWFVIPLFPLMLIFFVCMLAETNRAPFDLPEAEAELVAGYNVDYSSITFALFFLGEYANMLLMSALMVILFFGGWLPFFGLSFFSESIIFAIKIIIVAFGFIWVRATLPRYRYDQLMSLGWKCFLPFTFGFFLFITGILWFVKFEITLYYFLGFTDERVLREFGPFPIEGYRIWSGVMERSFYLAELTGTKKCDTTPEYKDFEVDSHYDNIFQ